VNLKERVAIITGAAGGIGAAIAAGFRKEGVEVLMAEFNNILRHRLIQFKMKGGIS
jgi:NAD(P)-dependent dehydrogenase (short-subunit alcohol dehydrogenase family)